MSKFPSLITLVLNKTEGTYNIGFSPCGITKVEVAMYKTDFSQVDPNLRPFSVAISILNQPTIPHRSEFVTNAIHLPTSGGNVIQLDPGTIFVSQDQLWNNERELRIKVLDYNGLPVPTPFRIFIVLRLWEKEINMEFMHGPGPVTLKEHPHMLENFNIMWRG